jgi:hypothetical protein
MKTRAWVSESRFSEFQDDQSGRPVILKPFLSVEFHVLPRERRRKIVLFSFL